MRKKLSIIIEALTLSNDSGMGKINRIYLKGFLEILKDQQITLLSRHKIPIALPKTWTHKKQKAKPFRFWCEFIFPWIIYQKKPDITICLGMNIPKIRPKGCYLMLIHDMSPLENLPFRASLHQDKNKKKFPVMISRSDYIITNSQFTKNRINQISAFPKEKIFVWSPRAEEAFELKENVNNPIADVSGPAIPTEPYFFSCGNLEPRKNFEGLVQAYDAALQSNPDIPDLYIAGHKAWGYENLFHSLSGLSCRPNVHLLGRISNTSLKNHIGNCAIFVASSLYEGWGFPLYEALLAKRVCIYHKESSQHEFAEGLALAIDVSDPKILGEAILSLWTSPQKRLEMEQKLESAKILDENQLWAEMDMNLSDMV